MPRDIVPSEVNAVILYSHIYTTDNLNDLYKMAVDSLVYSLNAAGDEQTKAKYGCALQDVAIMLCELHYSDDAKLRPSVKDLISWMDCYNSTVIKRFLEHFTIPYSYDYAKVSEYMYNVLTTVFNDDQL